MWPPSEKEKDTPTHSPPISEPRGAQRSRCVFSPMGGQWWWGAGVPARAPQCWSPLSLGGWIQASQGLHPAAECFDSSMH